MPERLFNLVVPLAHEATAMRTTGTGQRRPARPGAVSPLIGFSLLQGDVDSTMGRSTPTIPTMRGTRTSTMATRTTTTSRTPAALAPSADQNGDEFTFEDLVVAYFDCRRNKRNTPSALAFEQHLERNLMQLHEELCDGSYTPGRSICFVVTHPKAREVWAAGFRDRVVHHLLYNRVAPRFYASFIANSCACIPGRGTLYGLNRLEGMVRSQTQNWSRPAWYLKCDLANFFVSINKQVLHGLLTARIHEAWWLRLAETILFHDPRQNYELRSAARLLERVPPHKRLVNQPSHLGLPIGNLSSQFFANVFLDVLDQYAKHKLKARHYIRYVDDFILLHESRDWLVSAHDSVAAFLPTRLGVQLNPRKTILQPIARGVDFVGHVVKPWHTHTRRKTVCRAVVRLADIDANRVHATANSYFGLLRQSNSSHHDRAVLARALLRRGHAVNQALTKTYQRSI
ncbi:RNA-directed DNA polymerase [Pseudoduganella sp. RAF19]